MSYILGNCIFTTIFVYVNSGALNLQTFCACARYASAWIGCILTWDLAKSRLGAKLHAIYSFRFLHRSWVLNPKPPRGNSIAPFMTEVTILFAYRSCTLLRNWHRSSVAVRCLVYCAARDVRSFIHSDSPATYKCALIDWLIDWLTASVVTLPTDTSTRHSLLPYYCQFCPRLHSSGWPVFGPSRILTMYTVWYWFYVSHVGN